MKQRYLEAMRDFRIAGAAQREALGDDGSAAGWGDVSDGRAFSTTCQPTTESRHRTNVDKAPAHAQQDDREVHV
jgi:hypothetical protein